MEGEEDEEISKIFITFFEETARRWREEIIAIEFEKIRDPFLSIIFNQKRHLSLIYHYGNQYGNIY